jgi:hypothetical protein
MAKAMPTQRLVQFHAVILVQSLGKLGVLVRGRPIEITAINDDAAHGVAVAADELGQRMDDDVRRRA